MKELREGGQRGFVVGDNHDKLSTPVYLRDNMDRFKEMGVNKLYVEFNDDIKPMLGSLSDSKAAGELIMKGMDTQIAMASSDSVKRLDGLSDSFNLAGKKPEAAKDDLAFAQSD